MQRIFHTPEGVRDIYSQECSRKQKLQEKLHRVFHQYGFEDIETPTFEYFEVFSKEVGTIPSRELYKFFDREGNTLVLRPDFTPSVSRACATYFDPEKGPVRLCYTGNTFINNSSYRGQMKENTQMGVEHMGDDSAAAFESNGAEGKVVVGGSSSVSPVMEKLIEAYKAVNANVEIELQTSDSTTGMTGAADGTLDIGMASRELKDSETEEGLIATKIAMDGIAVIVNKANPTEEMTSDQVKSIYLGDVLTWDEIAE